MHARAQGQKTTLTRQPIPGRSNNGGLKIGEMEKDSLLVHGAVDFLHEKMFTLSDHYTVKVCRTCKSFSKVKVEATYNSLGGGVCKMCNGSNVVSCNMPYAAKLLHQELTSMGIKVGVEV